MTFSFFYMSSSSSSPPCWLVSVPNEPGQLSQDTIKKLKYDTASTQNDLAECYEFELPSDLLVGTLNSLMSLSDELNRVDMSIENVVRKIERQFNDLNQGDEVLTVDGVPVNRYLNHYAWDEAKHPHRRPLSEIVSIIQTTIGKVEEELKQLSTMYSEKRQQLTQLQRKKGGGNLMVANLDDVLTPDLVTEKDFLNTEYLKTLVAIIPKACEEQWKEEYFKIGEDIADYGPVGTRGSVKGSPVVPNSSKKLLESGDSVLYTVTVLKGQYQAGCLDNDGNFEPGMHLDYTEGFKNLAREKRYIIRDFTFNPSAQRENEQAQAELEVEVDRLWSGLLRWCKAHFGEAFIAWMHIKAVRIFVESVLRYGLPINFTVLLFRVHKGKDKKLRSVLAKKYSHLQPTEMTEDDNSGQTAEFFPYVTNTFNAFSA